MSSRERWKREEPSRDLRPGRVRPVPSGPFWLFHVLRLWNSVAFALAAPFVTGL